ncbi:MAG: toxin-antitoxin system YwqK family antitoxin [Cyclobacteriaceae bacterium]
MVRLAYVLSFIVSITSAQGLLAQTSTEEEPLPLDTAGQFILDPATKVPLTINMDAEEEEEEEKSEKKEKKRKRNVFYDIKTRKGFTKSGYGQDVIIETFYILKNYEQPDPYVRDIYWYDTKRKQVRSTPNVQKDKAQILHGPYRKMTEDGEVLEEGVFYKGTKHGRWTRYNKNFILLDKQKYSKGWPRDSEITYYDRDERTKLTEVIPIEYGQREGYYYYFHESGEIAVEGEYQQGKKVGLWTEYYDYARTRLPKKQIRYPDDPFDETPPYTFKEWDPQGKVTFDYSKK